MSMWGQMNLMDPASSIQMEMLLFQDHTYILLIIILSLTLFLSCKLLLGSFSARSLHEAQALETIWTILPAISLLFLAIPSLHLLYSTDSTSSEGNIFKVVGHQWYWSYEVPNQNLSFDSYMIREEDLTKGGFRLLEVDNSVTLNLGEENLLLGTSSDVIHAWALPSMGVKVDMVPGRINSLSFRSFLPGVFYGQCSEICGANHSFMPISVMIKK